MSAVADCVQAWLEGKDITMFDPCYDEPFIAWQSILEILDYSLTDEQYAILAAGPLEILLSLHGESFIERVELQAAKDDRFKFLLSGVWKNSIADEIWKRIEAAREQVW